MEKYLVGSALLGLRNQKDTDYVVIIKDNEEINKESTIDLHVIKEKELLDCFKFKNENGLLQLVIYQYDENIIKQNFPFKFNILEHKLELINYLDDLIKNKKMNFNNRITCGENCCSKYIYHIAYSIFILENEDTKLTEEQKEIIQKLHDIKMNITYLSILKNKLEEIKKKNGLFIYRNTNMKINSLKQYLNKTDYVVIKLNEAKLFDENLYKQEVNKYEEVLKKRQETRAKINELETKIYG